MQGLSNEQILKLAGIASNKQKSEIDQVIAECLDVANAKYPRSNDKPYTWPTITFDLKGVVAGEAWTTEIRLNVDLLHEFYDEMLNQTLPHEVAHCITLQRHGYAVRSHGHEWQNVMHLLGKPPLRTHSMPAKKARIHKRPYLYECSCTHHRVTATLHNRMSTGRIYTCRRCKGRLTYKGQT